MEVVSEAAVMQVMQMSSGGYDAERIDRELHDTLAVLAELLAWTAKEVGEIESLAADTGSRLSPCVRDAATIYDVCFQGIAVAEHQQDMYLARAAYKVARLAAELMFWKLESNAQAAVEGWEDAGE